MISLRISFFTTLLASMLYGFSSFSSRFCLTSHDKFKSSKVDFIIVFFFFFLILNYCFFPVLDIIWCLYLVINLRNPPYQ